MAKKSDREKKWRGDRAPNEQTQLRIDDAARLLVTGVHIRQTQNLLISKYGVHRRTAARYITGALKRFREDAHKADGRSTGELREQHLQELMAIQVRAVQEGNLRVQLKCVLTKIALFGTAIPNRVEVEHGGSVKYEQMSEADLRQLATESSPALRRVK